MNAAKRLVFTVTPGRSGTKYLAHLLKGLPGMIVRHEAAPSFTGRLPQARHDPALAARFWLKRKLPFIYSLPGNVYIETSHYAAKGFIEPLLHIGVVPDLILLGRDARAVARSWFLIGGNAKTLHEGRFYKHMLGPHEPNFLSARDWGGWNDYQLCYWYALESLARMKHYERLIAAYGGKTLAISLPELATDDGYRRLLAWLGMPEAVIAARLGDEEMRARKVNEMAGNKRAKGREGELAALDLETLEVQVRRDCGLPEEVVNAILLAKNNG